MREAKVWSVADIRQSDLQHMPKVTNGHMQHKPYQVDFGTILKKRSLRNEKD